MSDKPWRKPGSDISDWFNYGFDEISWEAYCYRRRDLGELANVLKTSVLNFSGMPEDQLTALPPEVRQMVMTGTNAMLTNGGPNPGMMGPGVMMDMSGMMNPMAMGMNGDMSMMPVDGRAMGMMPDGTPTQGVPVVGANGTPEPGVAMMQEGYGGPGMMMTGEYGMQVSMSNSFTFNRTLKAGCRIKPRWLNNSSSNSNNNNNRCILSWSHLQPSNLLVGQRPQHLSNIVVVV